MKHRAWSNQNLKVSYLEVVLVVVGLVKEDPDAIEAAGGGSVVEVVLAQVGGVVNQPSRIISNYLASLYCITVFIGLNPHEGVPAGIAAASIP